MEGLHNKRRLKIGIIFNFSPDWMGGIVYIVSLIKTLDYLDDQDKPEVILFYRSDLKRFVDEIKYQYLKVLEWEFPSFYKGYLQSWLSRKNIFVDNILRHYDLDGLYPLHDFPVKTKTGTKLVSWYADLQHKYYPENFTWKKIIERNARIRFMLMNSNELVVSSHSVASDFAKFFKLPKTLSLHIYRFVSDVDGYDTIDINILKAKYGLPVKYFMISNQFHKHKNHKIVLEALALLKKRSVSSHIVITGKLPNETNSAYIEELNRLIEENHLQDQISFLGVIPRSEQIILIKYAQAVIQPSYFEGWSTVIEDAMSLQVPVIASSLPVNLEQLGPAGLFFEPYDEKELANILMNFPNRDTNDTFYPEYKLRMRNAAQNFINIFQV
jgi:glycosyltransferase involved in cell wall biosynthesis